MKEPMKKKSLIGLAMLSLAFGFTGGADEPSDVIQNPYGVCACVSRQWPPFEEFQIRNQEFARMHDASIGWIRTDFDWQNIERKQGVWDFSMLDAMLADARREKIRILPILGYGTPWASPGWDSPLYEEYVRKVVQRYGRELRIWEIWNEQNTGFWGTEPNPAEYVKFLKRIHAIIKEIDPGIMVLSGGTSGVPFEYLEGMMKNGLGEACDAVAIHPYQWAGLPEEIIPKLNWLKATMKKYHCEKPVWITEVGWSTAGYPDYVRKMFDASIRAAGIVPENTEAVFVCDAAHHVVTVNFALSEQFPKFKKVSIITLDELKKLNPKQKPFLMPCLDETFCGKYAPDLVNYVRNGGTILLPGGFSMFFDTESQPDGSKKQVEDKYWPNLHIAWDAWWRDAVKVPKFETFRKPAPGFENAFQVEPITGKKENGRYLSMRNMKRGDKFIPVLLGGDDKFTGPIAGVYKLNSDLKGNVIVCVEAIRIWKTSEAQQAKLLPRVYLAALSSGVDRIFWYNFRAFETDPNDMEAHFGIVKKDLAPKPAFLAYRALSAVCPEGSTRPVMKISGVYDTATWKRPDGVRVWALWRTFGQDAVKLTVRGNIEEIRNLFGEKQELPKDLPSSTEKSFRYEISDSVTYFIGPDALTLF